MKPRNYLSSWWKSSIAFLMYLFVMLFVVVLACTKQSSNPYEPIVSDPLLVQPKFSAVYGVTGYQANLVDSVLFISLLEGQSETKGMMREPIIFSIEEDYHCIRYSDENLSFDLAWDRVNSGRLLLSINGEEYDIVPDTETLQWEFQIGSLAQLKNHYEVISKFVSIAADFEFAYFSPTKIIIQEKKIGPRTTLKSSSVSLATLTEGGDICGGEYVHAWSTGWTSSGCCYNAEQEIHQKCTNEFCIGCCDVTGCDWGGLVGDFVGVCVAWGRACDSQ